MAGTDITTATLAHSAATSVNIRIPQDSAIPEAIYRMRVGTHRRLHQSEKNSETSNWLSAATGIKHRTHKTENQEQGKGTSELHSH